MKTIIDYLYKNANIDEYVIEASNAAYNGLTLKDVYLGIFADSICESEEEINEFLGLDKVANFFSKANKKGDEGVTKAKEVIKNAKAKVVAKYEEWSDDAKKAYQEIKDKAGDAWKSMKSGVQSIIGKIEGALKTVYSALKTVVKAVGLTIGGIICALAFLLWQLAKTAAKVIEFLFVEPVRLISLALLVVGVNAVKLTKVPEETVNAVIATLNKA